MKRSYDDFQRKPSCHDDDSDNSTRMNPVVIELDGGNSRNDDGYRRKDDARLLNLLLLAVMEKSNHSRDDNTVGAKLRYRNLVLKSNLAGASTTTSHPPSITNTRGMDSADRIPSDDRTLSPLSDCTPPKETFSILPNGRPLMAPPRLPTHLISRKARSVITNSTKLGITLPYEVRCMKTSRKRHKITSDQFP
eukprot:CAMPEP_0116097416 /NCGR_PEP_ID=MMETSP0327-20121206/10696_1 /TAXON_ID=44447 /ORGANISM="Pseudo-nitzschia delicatissima, Strain B596" /LENGTH=192 /DNA_ID=CAMNT_0003589171 /DNA_START=42 /DNA_END=620 /DNA_ORIENTATION=-